ncbi:endonuclease/exonuclease/phosphatase family protein [Flavobacterium sp. CS20]|uniref:endonuclease/exonuclease/phosphatase family protein n=1 Tax=Flavobacterium sp. CS20 TaxID=2775246 RepID=UPI001B3A7628|nr:endonuclease/exonuclease/phosphatase family protein [Flavobacterium sp. CS20]QTY27494.1 endonuclease/exonuclease/phosphatase family protein [Flavobacterium sp. CS20]
MNFSIPVLWIINFCFVLIWLLKLKKYFLLSFLVIVLGWFHFQKLFAFSQKKYADDEHLKVMSYNVMQFYSKNDARLSTYDQIKDFIRKENPSILCFQEFKNTNQHKFENFKFSSFDSTKNGLQSAIFSQHKIVNRKYFDFKNSGNSAVYADILVKKDTIRVFSTHFQSLNLKPDIKTIQEEPKEKLIKRLEKVFEKQMNQFDLIKDDIANSPYPVVFCADMNNTALSYLYRQLTDLKLKDSFLESG